VQVKGGKFAIQSTVEAAKAIGANKCNKWGN
jgi:hypothetical protein